MGDLGEGDRCADHDWQSRADARFDLMEDEGEPQRLAEMAGDLKETAVLPVEIDRRDRRLGALNELRDEGTPGRVDRRSATQSIGRRRNAAGRKHHDGAATFKVSP